MDRGFLAELRQLDALYKKLTGQELPITSGARCPAHSVAVGGTLTDAHTKGRAADVSFATGHDIYFLVRAAMLAGVTGIGVNPKNKHVHLDNMEDKEEYYRPGVWFE